ncbi:odorant receptor 67c-like isoform X2 [Tribolium madens]|uniref:odorant receptor 67c-like isoform X2 n=1 Tax=Tribolium madens TaxID=41895 RepID=UPI001CF74976|nr:odorant receptor 67c-like isoform X2 [Tribolium madens]
MEKFDWLSTIKTNIWLLHIVGLWPKDNQTYKCNYYTLYALSSGICFTVGHNLLQTINLFYIYNNLEVLTASIFVSLTQFIGIFKSLFIVKNIKTLKDLMDSLKSDTFQPKNRRQRELAQISLDGWQTMFHFFCGVGGFTVLILSVFPFLDQSFKQYRLPFLVWYPYDTNISPFYEITYLYQALCCYFISVVNMMTDTLIAALNMYIGAQCDILCDTIRHINGPDKELDVMWLNCIIHHRKILRFADCSQQYFNWIVLLQFAASVVSIGLSMFQLTVVVPFTSVFYTFCSYVVAIALETFIYCWYGNQVELKILQTSWSYFALLHQVNSKK